MTYSADTTRALTLHDVFVAICSEGPRLARRSRCKTGEIGDAVGTNHSSKVPFQDFSRIRHRHTLPRAPTGAATVDTVTTHSPTDAVLGLHGASVIHDGRRVVDGLTLNLHPGERWVVLGPNGCGKTTLLRVLSLYLHPTSGVVSYQGKPLGSFDVRNVRNHIAYSSASLAADLRHALAAQDVVMTAKYGALETWWHEYDDEDHRRALECLDRLGIETLAHRSFGTLSSGEQQRVLLARTLMCDPHVVLLDEPSARLDLGGRERLVADLDVLAATSPDLPMVLVTHHVDEIPTSCTHALLMKNGSSIRQGRIEDVMSSEHVSECFDVDLVVEKRHNRRWTAHRP